MVVMTADLNPTLAAIDDLCGAPTCINEEDVSIGALRPSTASKTATCVQQERKKKKKQQEHEQANSEGMRLREEEKQTKQNKQADPVVP